MIRSLLCLPLRDLHVFSLNNRMCVLFLSLRMNRMLYVCVSLPGLHLCNCINLSPYRGQNYPSVCSPVITASDLFVYVWEREMFLRPHSFIIGELSAVIVNAVWQHILCLLSDLCLCWFTAEHAFKIYLQTLYRQTHVSASVIKAMRK